MKTSNDFINWLEGYLDACKNKPSTNQLRVIRKKMTEVSSIGKTLSPIFGNGSDVTEIPNPEFLKEINARAHAGTMEQLERVG